MVVDTSALVAIVRDEPERSVFLKILETAPERVMSAVTWLECTVVMLGLDPLGMLLVEFENLVKTLQIQVVPFDGLCAAEAARAYRSYGKGRHPARLNLGDCAAYALAQLRDEPLLFKGNDFRQTDVAQFEYLY